MEQLAEASTDPKFILPVIEAIYARRSVRQYTSRKVDAKAVEELIGAAIQAPSAMNIQPWAFAVIQDREILNRISVKAMEFLARSFHWQKNSEHAKELPFGPGFDIFYGGSTLIVVCSEKMGFEPVGDCYLAAENLMLAATAMGLGTCPIGFARDVLKSDEFRKELAIPESHDPVLPIIVGYPSAVTQSPPRNPPNIFKWT